MLATDCSYKQPGHTITSINSQRCARPDSLASGISRMRMRMESTMAFLYSKPPSSRSTFDKKFINARYFCGCRQLPQQLAVVLIRCRP